MSSKKDSNNSSGDNIFSEEFVTPDSIDQALSALQSELDAAREKRNEERFYWICALIILIDIFTFQSMRTWSASITITFIEFIVLIGLGRMLGVDYIWTLTENFFNKWNGSLSGK